MINNKYNFRQSKVCFLTILTILFWLKYMFAFYFYFKLQLNDYYQQIIALISSLGSTIILFSIAFYITKPLLSYIFMILLDIANTTLLFSNIIYFRQFNDFLTFKTIQNTSKVTQGLGKSTVALMQPLDILIWLDIIVIVCLLLLKIIKLDQRHYNINLSFAITSFGLFVALLNLALAETARPKLLRNTFDRSYVVKYIGLSNYTLYDLTRSAQSGSSKKNINASQINKILAYTRKKYAGINPKYFGKAKGKNVIILHLESFQQFLIDLKINNKEVTPFLNSIYHSKNTISYKNFFHQVGLGRTSDAETMLETGTFGISDGPLFSSLGNENTFQAAPQILRQRGYTSAVFHGNIGTFWNRNEVYKNLGYNYFFDSSYYFNEKKDKVGYGLKDKLLFAESIKYLEQLQQPFYVKFLTVTNHYPYYMDSEDLDKDFKTTNTNNTTINNYFQTAHYLDQSIREFFEYLKKSGLDKKSIVILYGDHYGVGSSDNETNALAPILNKADKPWSEYDTINLQRVPFMIHMNGLKGGIKSNIAGEIDVLPTLLHLLGIDTKNYIQFGNDLLSNKRQKFVIFRNGTIITPHYIIVGGRNNLNRIYDFNTGEKINNLTDKQKAHIEHLIKQANKSLRYSDLLNNRNLLRFYTPKGFIPVDPLTFNYQLNYLNMIRIRKMVGNNSTSLYSENRGSTIDMYKTDAFQINKDKLFELPANVIKTRKEAKNLLKEDAPLNK